MKQCLFLLAVISSCYSCQYLSGSGKIITETRSVKDFNEISVGGAFEVELKNGPTSVQVEADDNILPYVKTEVVGNELKISTKSGASFNNGHYKVYISSPEINSIECSGAANLKTSSVLKNLNKITFKTSGAADVTAAVDAPEIIVHASGAGNLNLSGKTKNYTAESSGSADIKSTNLQTENADITVSGAGNIHTQASVSLKADASGAGSIYYKGDARVDQQVSGAGSIRREE